MGNKFKNTDWNSIIILIIFFICIAVGIYTVIHHPECLIYKCVYVVGQ